MLNAEKLVRKGWSGKAGLYASVIPNKHSKDIIVAIADVLETECNREQLHCAIIHSPYDVPKEKSVYPKTKTFRAMMKDIKLFGKNQNSLVIILESNDLMVEHERLKALGARHSREFYLPHITIQTNKPFNAYYLDNVADTINGREILLNDYSWDDVSDD